MFAFSKTTSTDFAIIKDGVDTSLEIIVHKATGFFNITKIAALVKKLKIEEQAKQAVNGRDEAGGIPLTSKVVKNWFINNSTKELLEACKKLHNLEEVKYELRSDTPVRFAGTYLQRSAYDHFMMWLDTTYALRVSALLESHRIAAQNEKDIEITRLCDKIDKQSEKMTEQSKQIAELLGYGKQANKNCKKIEKKVDKLSDQMTDAVDRLEDQSEMLTNLTSFAESSHTMLDDRSRKSTMNPEQESLHHYFACTGYTAPDGKRVAKFISGQKDYVERKVAEYTSKDVLPHEVLLAPFYNANPIDLRNNSKVEYIRRRAELITRLNVENKAADDTYNAEQKVSIKLFNKSLQGQITKLRAKIRTERKKQSISDENIFEYEADIEILDSQKMKPVLRKTPKIKVGDITIDFKRSLVIYANNQYITFDEVLKVVSDMNGSTQENPVPISEEIEEIKNREAVPTYEIDDESDDE